MRHFAYSITMIRELLLGKGIKPEDVQSYMSCWLNDDKLKKIRIRGHADRTCIVLGDLLDYLWARGKAHQMQLGSDPKSQLSMDTVLASMFELEGLVKVVFAGFADQTIALFKEHFPKNSWELAPTGDISAFLADLSEDLHIDCLVIDSSIGEAEATRLVQGVGEISQEPKIPVVLFHNPADGAFTDARGFLTIDKGMGSDFLIATIESQTEAWCQNRPLDWANG